MSKDESIKLSVKYTRVSPFNYNSNNVTVHIFNGKKVFPWNTLG